MNKKPYSSAIKKTPFKYTIAKKVAKLILDGLDRNEVFEKCYNDNYIEIDSVQRRKEITNVVYERLIQLDKYLLRQFYDGDVITSKFILVYAIAKSDSLFFDFLFEVYRDALLSDKKYISIDDFEAFFEKIEIYKIEPLSLDKKSNENVEFKLYGSYKGVTYFKSNNK